MAELNEGHPAALDGLSEDELRQEFHAQTARIHWHELQPHYARGAVVIVSASLDLVEVAMQLRTDNTAQFQAWIAEGTVAGVSDELATEWYAANPEVWAVVVPPWVLVQAVSESD